MGTRDVSQCFECGVVGEGEVDIDDGLFYCYACWLIYHAARARLRRDTTHVQPARNFQGVSFALESAQHEQSVQDVSFTSGRRPQLRRLGTCKCAHVQDVSFVPGRGHGSLLDMPTFALIPRGAGGRRGMAHRR